MKSSRRDREAAEIDLYLRQVARPAQKGKDPNDRRHDRDIERKMRRLKPQALDALLNADEE